MLYARQVGGSLAFCAVSFEGYYYAVRLGSFCLYHLRRASYILYILYRLIISKQCFFSFSFQALIILTVTVKVGRGVVYN